MGVEASCDLRACKSSMILRGINVPALPATAPPGVLVPVASLGFFTGADFKAPPAPAAPAMGVAPVVEVKLPLREVDAEEVGRASVGTASPLAPPDEIVPVPVP